LKAQIPKPAKTKADIENLEKTRKIQDLEMESYKEKFAALELQNQKVLDETKLVNANAERMKVELEDTKI